MAMSLCTKEGTGTVMWFQSQKQCSCQNLKKPTFLIFSVICQFLMLNTLPLYDCYSLWCIQVIFQLFGSNKV